MLEILGHGGLGGSGCPCGVALPAYRLIPDQDRAGKLGIRRRLVINFVVWGTVTGIQARLSSSFGKGLLGSSQVELARRRPTKSLMLELKKQGKSRREQKGI